MVPRWAAVEKAVIKWIIPSVPGRRDSAVQSAVNTVLRMLFCYSVTLYLLVYYTPGPFIIFFPSNIFMFKNLSPSSSRALSTNYSKSPTLPPLDISTTPSSSTLEKCWNLFPADPLRRVSQLAGSGFHPLSINLGLLQPTSTYLTRVFSTQFNGIKKKYSFTDTL